MNDDDILFLEDPAPQDFSSVLSRAIDIIYFEADAVLIEVSHQADQFLEFGKPYIRLCIFTAA